ncbi:MAG: TetR/AcrR family transcriptional regulator, partial [Oceanisphaera sp.]|nr:TetR/AcrR family transcriptional regulator [Oceanisphaera sp.]
MDKRQQLITTAFDLFYRQGIHAVGINQILQASGIAKKTLYHHFSGKEALVAAVVAYRDSTYLAWLNARLAREEPTVTGLIDALFAALDDWINDREEQLTRFHGCFFINC